MENWLEAYYCILQARPRLPTLFSEGDKEDFLRAIADLRKSLPVKLYAFALLDTQVHLVLGVPAFKFAPVLDRLREACTNCYLRRHGGDVEVFLDTYQERQCRGDSSLLLVVRHVHMLPVTLGITNHPNLARFTSHMAYLGDLRNAFVDSGEVLSLISSDIASARREYQRYAAVPVSDNGLAQAFKSVESGLALLTAVPPTLDAIAIAVSERTGVTLRTMQGKGRTKKAVAARRMLIATAVLEHQYPVTKVATFLGVHHSYVSRLTFKSLSAP